jgi:tRNA 2-thiouridine synthesizing protein E
MYIETTEDGYLRNLQDWTPEVANELALRQNIQLNAAHWEIINLLREFYFAYNASPAMRTLVKAVQQQYGAEKGNSIYLHTLFPGGAAKQANNIAGLPKPIRCI